MSKSIQYHIQSISFQPITGFQQEPLPYLKGLLLAFSVIICSKSHQTCLHLLNGPQRSFTKVLTVRSWSFASVYHYLAFKVNVTLGFKVGEKFMEHNLATQGIVNKIHRNLVFPFLPVSLFSRLSPHLCIVSNQS